MNDTTSPDTRESIRLAAIDLLEREGGGEITTRAIAAAAKVNVAAINYYYRSKDALLEEALKSSWDHAMGHFRSFLAGDPWNCREGLKAMVEFLLEGGVKFPNISRAHLLGLKRPEEGGSATTSIVATGIRRIIEETAAKTGAALGVEPDERLILRTGSFFASILYPSLLPAAFPPIETKEARENYKNLLVDDYLSALQRIARGEADPGTR